MAEIIIAQHAGACYGVERALRMVETCIDERTHVHTLGPLIHNPVVVESLAERGVTAIDDLDDLEPGDTVVIRSHGVAPELVERAYGLGLEVVDATCPHVKKAHEGAAELASEGYQVVVIGEAGHPEVEGILARAGSDAVCIGSAEQAQTIDLSKRVGVVVQTTHSQALLSDIVAVLVTRVRELSVINTICAATVKRQDAARKLAGSVDVMVVVGGKNSGNTRRLVEVCSSYCPATYHIEVPSELQAAWFADAQRIGVTAGASTPAYQVEDVVRTLEQLTSQETV